MWVLQRWGWGWIAQVGVSLLWVLLQVVLAPGGTVRLKGNVTIRGILLLGVLRRGVQRLRGPAVPRRDVGKRGIGIEG